MYEHEKSIEKPSREKQNRKRNSRKYGQARLRHSYLGLFSCWYAMAAFVLLMVSVSNAFLTSGQASGIVGGLGIMAVFLTIFGFRLAVKGTRERERNYITCKVGKVANALIFIMTLLIYISGFMR